MEVRDFNTEGIRVWGSGSPGRGWTGASEEVASDGRLADDEEEDGQRIRRRRGEVLGVSLGFSAESAVSMTSSGSRICMLCNSCS